MNQPDVDGDRTQLDWFAAGEPVFGVDPVHDQVDGWGWAPDVPLEVTIPGSPLGTYEWQTGGDGSFWFDIHNWPDEERFDIVAGATITVSDGSSTKSLVVSDLVVNPLAGPDQIPVGATTIAGVGDETQGPVVVEAWSLGEDYPTTFTVNDWVSDTFSQVLVRGDNGVVIQTEADDSEGLGDQTRVQWRVPYPAFTVNPENDGVWGDQWAPGLLVSVEVFESDESTSKGTAEGFADGDGQFQIDLSAETVPIDVVPGDFVAVTDGVTSKTHSVIDLSVGVVDADTDVVSGSTGELGFGVDVWVNGGPQTQDVAPDGSGDWSVDFMAEFGHDLQPGDNGGVNQPDVDGDRTQLDWSIPRVPNFSVRIDEGEVHGYNWPLGTDVTLEIDDPGNGVGVDYAETMAPEEAPWWGPGFTFVQIPVADGGFTLAAGQLVTMTNGDVTKTHTVTDLTVTDVNETADTVSGTTSSGFDSVNVSGWDEGNPYRHAANVAGAWSADFSVPWEDQGTWDIEPGTQGYAEETDEDGDGTNRRWGIPNPAFNVDVENNQIWGNDWAPGTLEITIDGGAPWTVPVSDGTDGMQPGGFHLDLNNDPEPWDVVTGETITVTHTGTSDSKDHTVTSLTAMWVGGSQVGGAADDGSTIDVWLHHTNIWRTENVASAAWSADFSLIGDDEWETETRVLQPGDNGAANQCDAENDCTWAEWAVPVDPWVEGIVAENAVNGYYFELGVPAELDVERWNVGLSDYEIIYEETLTTYDPGWGFGSSVVNFTVPDLQVGDIVTIIDGTTEKSLVVTDFTFVVDYDSETVTVSGVATGTEIQVHVQESAWRSGVADGGGEFVADFANPAPEDDRTEDLTPDTNGDVMVLEPDLDHTTQIFGPGPPPENHFAADPQHDQINGWQWPADGSLTVQVDDNDEPGDGVLYELTAVLVDPDGNFGVDLTQGAGFDLLPGHIVRVIDENIADPMPTKDTVVNPLTLVEPLAFGGPLLTGTGDELIGEVRAYIDDDPGEEAIASFVGSDWTAMFTQDILPGMSGSVSQAEQGVNDGDRTEIWWGTPMPTITVQVDNDESLG